MRPASVNSDLRVEHIGRKVRIDSAVDRQEVSQEGTGAGHARSPREKAKSFSNRSLRDHGR